MTVYVDNSCLSWRGKSWCHLVADSITELHQFAELLGLKREWFQDQTQYPHYDVTVAVKVRALRIGALVGDKRTIISCAKRLKIEMIVSRSQFGTKAHPKQDNSFHLSSDLCTNTPIQQSLWST
jgi:Protein of unknown function (DUF4031)